MAGQIDLKSALDMFQEGAKNLMFTRALSDANEQVQQIKASELNEQQQRAQLQQVSNALVGHMSMLGVPATTMQMVSNSIAPHFANANEMAVQANLTGNSQLMDEAKQQQAFEQDPEYKKELIQAKYAGMGMMRQQREEDKNIGFFKDYAHTLNTALASSRSAYGQWANTEARGQRLDAILGDKSQWSNLTAEQLQLLSEGLIQLSKGGVATKEEMEALLPNMVKIKAARAQTLATGQPVPLDLSGYAGLYHNVIQSEESQAEKKLTTIGMNIATGNMKLYKRDPEQFKRTTASQISTNLGRVINPDDIIVDDKRVKIKAGAIKNAPRLDEALGLEDSPSNNKITFTPVKMKNKKTGQLESVLKGSDGNIYPLSALAKD